MSALYRIADDLRDSDCDVVAGTPKPSFLARLEGELVAGAETLLARHVEFDVWLIDHGREDLR